MRIKGILFILIVGSLSGDGIFLDRFFVSSFVLKIFSLVCGIFLGQFRQVIVVGMKVSVMELLQVLFGDEVILDGREVGNIGKFQQEFLCQLVFQLLFIFVLFLCFFLFFLYRFCFLGLLGFFLERVICLFVYLVVQELGVYFFIVQEWFLFVCYVNVLG